MKEPLDDLRASVSEWLSHAQEDLESVKRSLQPPPLVASALFHSQQAAEKALKGYLVALGMARIPRTHDLALLAEAVQAAGGNAPTPTDLSLLNDFGSRVRYPDERQHDLEEALEAQEAAACILRRLEAEIRGILGQ
ncbi:MAG TPA: HEPN domain-containing protein [Armatimonadota bacterium]